MTRSQHAFTLIEMMIAIALGLAIVYMAFAGFRAASQSVTAVNRLSIENTLLRAGYHAAHEELDFWRMYDDPDDATRQQLRAPELPFQPFTAWTYAGGSGGTEADTGWERRNSLNFAPHHPRSWCRVNMTDTVKSDCRSGQYGMYSNRTAGASLNNFWNSSGYSGMNVAHLWYATQLHGLWDQIGTYGMMAYMPSNAIYGAYGDYVAWSTSPKTPDTNPTSILSIWLNPDAEHYPPFPAALGPDLDPWGFCNYDGYQMCVRGRYRVSYRTAFMVPNPNFGSGNLLHDSRREWEADYGGATSTDLPLLMERTSVPIGLLDGPDAGLVNDPGEKPETWPDAQVAVARVLKDARFVNLCRIRWTNPLTGAVQELSFSGFGTTLRGARQQRRSAAGGGWARWHGAGHASNDATLDN
ncbi:MAG: prepilin-type N-terminal cleavage/methylation domain-containing protein [Planctomycetes bacterium]|nr:prepilin-type N-terminal cleavage/methylation domain-containing protein [Planctomycetota bacterium]